MYAKWLADMCRLPDCDDQAASMLTDDEQYDLLEGDEQCDELEEEMDDELEDDFILKCVN